LTLRVPFPDAFVCPKSKLLGISAITYVLAAAIVISLGLNFFLGPGWLGQALGLSGTGSFTETSGSIPESLDLSDPAYLL
jgi:hypothetical protein